MLFSEVAIGRKFQVGTNESRVSDVFLKVNDDMAVDVTYAVYMLPPETPVAEVVEAEQPKKPM